MDGDAVTDGGGSSDGFERQVKGLELAKQVDHEAVEESNHSGVLVVVCPTEEVGYRILKKLELLHWFTFNCIYSEIH